MLLFITISFLFNIDGKDKIIQNYQNSHDFICASSQASFVTFSKADP